MNEGNISVEFTPEDIEVLGKFVEITRNDSALTERLSSSSDLDTNALNNVMSKIENAHREYAGSGSSTTH